MLHFKTIIIVSKPLQRHLSFKSYNVPPRQEQAILTARKESLPAPNVPLMPHLNTYKDRQALTCLFLLGWSFFFLFFYLYNISYSSFFLSFYFLILALPLINLILVWYFFFTRWGIFLTPTFIFFCIRHIKVTGFEPMALCTQNRCANQTALHLVSPPPGAYRSTRSMNTWTELAHPFGHRDARTNPRFQPLFLENVPPARLPLSLEFWNPARSRLRV